MSSPTHHLPGGGFRNPWPGAVDAERGLGALLKWQLERLRDGTAPPPAAEAFPPGTPDVAYPAAPAGELRITWVGHSTLLIQVAGRNLLTDPVWSRRASPVQWAGPARIVEPGLAWEALPAIDAVLISHDHYDHLDRDTVARLHERFGDGLRWLAPLGFAAWFRRLGVHGVDELDWWQERELAGGAAPLRVAATPAQHWSRRSPLENGRPRLWCSWTVLAPDVRVYYAGDTGYFPGFAEIGARYGPFDVAALPIGAYAPRWFMSPAHMDPAEAVQGYKELGGSGALLPIHWGTFRLTDEPMEEPPRLLQDAWRSAGLPAGDLALLRHGDTLLRRPWHAGTK